MGCSGMCLGASRPRKRREQILEPGLRADVFLLIEDNALNQEVARELLAGMGAEVDTASDGTEGVEKFRQSPDGSMTLF